MADTLFTALARRTGMTARTTCGTARGGGPSIVIEFADDRAVRDAFLAIAAIEGSAPVPLHGAVPPVSRHAAVAAAGRALDRANARAARAVRGARAG